MYRLKELQEVIEAGDTSAVTPAVTALLEAGFPPEQILRDAMMPALQEVGRRFEDQSIFIPEMLTSARAFKIGSEALREQIGETDLFGKTKIVLGTVQNDLHDLGKNLVGLAMRGIGLSVVDLGVDVAPEAFVRAVEADEDVAFVGISALLTTTLPDMARTVKALRACRAADRIKILVGGAPVTAKFARRIGADIYTDTAFEAAEAVRALLLQKESRE